MKHIPLVLILLLLLSGTSTGQVNVTLPQVQGEQGDTLDIPVVIDSLAGSKVLSYEFILSYSQSVVHGLSTDTDSTLSNNSNWTVMSSVSSGAIHVAGYGATSLVSTGGILIKLRFIVVGVSGSASSLTFSSFTFNAGSPTAITTSGAVSIPGTPPDSPVLVSPTASSSLSSNGTVRFSWNSTGTGNGYRLQIAADTLFNTIVEDDSSIIGTSCLVDSLGTYSVYYWRMKSKNLAGWSDWSGTWKFGFTLTGVFEKMTTPNEVALAQNYPNPWNPATTIEYSVPRQMHVSLRLYSVLGQFIAQLVDGDIPAGVHRVVLQSENLAAGMYLYQLRAGNISLVRKTLLLK